MSNLTREEIEYLQGELNEKFGKELKQLENTVMFEMRNHGHVSGRTIKKRDELFKRILEEKNKKYGL